MLKGASLKLKKPMIVVKIGNCDVNKIASCTIIQTVQEKLVFNSRPTTINK